MKDIRAKQSQATRSRRLGLIRRQKPNVQHKRSRTWDLLFAMAVTLSVALSVARLGYGTLLVVTPIVDQEAALLLPPTTPRKEAQPQQRPPDCTRAELLEVRRQLDPNEGCLEALGQPWLQTCSITKKTKCPDSWDWLGEHYSELQTAHYHHNNHGEGERKGKSEPFVAISVGCNKGFDALETLRMGTFDDSFRKADWGTAMGAIYQSVCAQDATPEFPVKSQPTTLPRRGEVHCFEPMPNTHARLANAATSLGYDQKGFVVVHAAVSKTPGTAVFSAAGAAGVENNGLATGCQGAGCEEVRITTLEDYVAERIDHKNNHTTINAQQQQQQPIHILQIDVEGFDGDAMAGAGPGVMGRVEYLEFEYNWMGPWKRQHLYDFVTLLDDRDGFTCYWAGAAKLWRITGCWMQYYDVHTWSNVACVNRRRVPGLASRMEAVFRRTLGNLTDTPVANNATEGVVRHAMLSTDPVQMKSPYLNSF